MNAGPGLCATCPCMVFVHACRPVHPQACGGQQETAGGFAGSGFGVDVGQRWVRLAWL